MCIQLIIKSGNPNFKDLRALSSCPQLVCFIYHSVHSRSTQRREMLLCYRVGFLKLRLQFHMGFVLVHLRGGQGRNTAHPGGSKGKAQRGLLSVHFLCLDHQHHFPNQLCLDLLKHIGSTHRKAKITAFTFRAQRGIWKVNFAFWPTGLRVTLLASC